MSLVALLMPFYSIFNFILGEKYNVCLWHSYYVTNAVAMFKWVTLLPKQSSLQRNLTSY